MTSMWREEPLDLRVGDTVGCDKAILKEGEGEVVEVNGGTCRLRAEGGREAGVRLVDRSLTVISRAADQVADSSDQD